MSELRINEEAAKAVGVRNGREIGMKPGRTYSAGEFMELLEDAERWGFTKPLLRLGPLALYPAKPFIRRRLSQPNTNA